MGSGKQKKDSREAKNLLLIDRSPTGIAGFDELIEGGFTKESINLLTGDTGTGKSIFGIQYLVNGITKYNENGVYINFEEKREDVYKRMLQFGWDLKKLETQGKFAFLEYTPEQVEKVLEAGGGIASDIVVNLNAKRIVIDTITAFSMLFQTPVEKRQGLIELIDLIKKWKCTALWLSESSQELHKHIANIEEFEVDGDMITYSVLDHSNRQRFIEIFKMRGTKHSNKIFKLDITKEGIKIKNAEGDPNFTR